MESKRTAILHLSLVSAALLLATGTAFSDTAFLQTTREVRKTEEAQEITEGISISNALVDFGLTYSIVVGGDMPKGRCTSTQWVYKIGMPTVGMTQPASCNWYSQGFFDVLLNGESLKDYTATIEPVRTGGPDAMATATWQTDNGVVRVHFLLRRGDDKLLMRIEWDSEKTPESVELKLLAYPSWFYGEKDRWMVTNTRQIQHSQTVQWDLSTECWALYEDRGTPSRGSWGACAVMGVPTESREIVTEVTDYAVWTHIHFFPETGRGTIALWDFTGAQETAAESTAYLQTNGTSFLADLQTVAQAAWAEAVFQEPAVPTDRRDALAENNGFEETPFDKMTDTISSRGQSWAKPLDGGPVRVLVLAPRWSQRETVELGQRLDIEYVTASVSRSNVLFDKRSLDLYGSYELYGYKPRNALACLDSIHRKLQEDYDCVIIADVSASIFPDFFIQLIEKKVQSGTGLMLTGASRSLLKQFHELTPSADPFIAHIPLGALPVFRNFSWDGGNDKSKLADTYTLGNGRCISLRYPVSSRSGLCLTPSVQSEPDAAPRDYDYYQSLVAKCVLWAANRTPAARIATIDAGNITIELKKPATDLTVEIQTRDRLGRLEYATTVPVPERVGTSNIPLLNMHLPRGGAHFLDVCLSRGQYVVDWGSITFDTESPWKIDTITINEPVNPRDGLVAGTVSLLGIDVSSQLMLNIEDSYGRLVASQELSLDIDTSEVRFALPFPEPIAVCHRLIAELRINGVPVDWGQQEFTVPNSAIDDFMFVMWSSAPNNTIRDMINEQLAKAGVDSIDNVGLTNSDGPTMARACRNASWQNLRSIPYITRIASMQKTGLVRKPCLTDPKYLETWMNQLRERTAAARPYGPPAYTLGDENFLVSAHLDVCRSPTCLAEFRAFLEKEYGDIQQLNASWKTSYTSWQDVMPITLEEARESGHFPSWADHRRFMDTVLTRAHVLGRQAIRDVDPEARVGFDGIFSLDSWHGYDFYHLVKACDLNQVYALRLNQIEYVRSFHEPNTLLGAWHNRIGNADEVSARRVPWHLLFHGFNSGWYWTSYNTGPAALFPDLRETPQLKWMSEAHGEIKAGIGKLLMNCTRDQDGIAIHYSQNSVHAATLMESNLADAHWGAFLAVEDAGLQYDFLATEQIEQGELRKYRLIIMPESRSLTAKETEAIRHFVTDGGTVIADIQPAIMNEHAAKMPSGMLADVFPPAPAEAPPETMPEEGQCTLAGKACGKGVSLLLGYPFSQYRSLRDKGNEKTFRNALSAFLSERGIKPHTEATRMDGKPADVCEIVHFKNNQSRLVGITTEDNVATAETQDTTVRFPGEYHVYDVRQKQYLGKTSQIRAELAPGVPRLYALSKHRINGLTVEAGQNDVPAGKTAKLKIHLDVTGVEHLDQHVIRVDIRDPAGKVRECYCKNLLTHEPDTWFTVNFALNDPTGAWQITTMDVMTGAQGTATVSVTSGN